MTEKELEMRDAIARDAMRYFIDSKVFNFDEHWMDPLRLAWWSYELADGMMVARAEPPRTKEDFKQTLTIQQYEMLKKFRSSFYKNQAKANRRKI